MKIIPSIFKNKQAKHPWQWPSCKHPKTLSFRAHDVGCDDLFPTIDDSTLILDESLTTKHSSNCASFSTDDTARSLEMMISTVRVSERLFFEPEETSSIVNIKDSKNGNSNFPFKDSVAMALESDDPYLDFKKSMEEMVESDEGLLKDWDCLEELLLWYLKMNGKINHRFIVGAFVDLLVGFADVDSRKKTTTMMVSGSDSTTTTYSSASSSFSSPSSPLSPHQL